MKRLLASVLRAAPLVESLGDPKREALISGYHSAALTNLGRTQEAIPFALQGLSIAHSLDDPLLRISAEFFAAQVKMRTGAFRDAIEHVERDVGLSTDRLVELAIEQSARGTLDARSALASHFFTKVEGTLIYAELGSFDTAIERANETLQIAEKLGLVYFRALSEIGMGWVYSLMGESSDAIAFLERGVTLAEETDFPGAILNGTWALAQVYNVTGQPDEAARLTKRAWKLAEAGGFYYFGGLSLVQLAYAYSLTDEPSMATSTIEQALELARSTGFRGLEAWAFQMRGVVLMNSPAQDLAATEAAFQSACALATQLEMRPLAAHCHAGLGRLKQSLGQQAEAREDLTRASEMYGEIEMQFYLKQAETDLEAIH